MLIDFLYETLVSGGVVLFPILIIGALGFYFLGLAYFEMGSLRSGNQLIRDYDELLQYQFEGNSREVEQILSHNHSTLKPYIKFLLDHREMSQEELVNRLKEMAERKFLIMDRHIPLVNVFAAVAPLLGLLGTVMGMVKTFDVITVFGNSNPMLMADGISEALITTQSGLVVAFPLLLLSHQIQDRIHWQKNQLQLMVARYMNIRYGITSTPEL